MMAFFWHGVFACVDESDYGVVNKDGFECVFELIGDRFNVCFYEIMFLGIEVNFRR